MIKMETPCPRKQFMSFILSALPAIFSGASATSFNFVNECGYTVWPGVLSNAGWSLLANGGFVLESGQSGSLSAPKGWSGRFWGRTGCTFSSSGMGTCASGDCGGKLQCGGAGATPPATLAEITLAGSGTATKDFYDVSLVDGYNLPITMTPKAGSGSCGIAGCISNLNNNCPDELQVVDDKQIVACKSACEAFQSAQYCCNGAYANPTTCKPTTYSQLFKSSCPHAYSYAFDDPSSIFTCSNADYTITFCPKDSSEQHSKLTSVDGGSQQHFQENTYKIPIHINSALGSFTLHPSWLENAIATQDRLVLHDHNRTAVAKSNHLSNSVTCEEEGATVRASPAF